MGGAVDSWGEDGRGGVRGMSKEKKVLKGSRRWEKECTGEMQYNCWATSRPLGLLVITFK